MEYTYHLIWHSKYGSEEIDSCDTLDEAKRLSYEYRMAFGEGYVEIAKLRSRQ